MSVRHVSCQHAGLAEFAPCGAKSNTLSTGRKAGTGANLADGAGRASRVDFRRLTFADAWMSLREDTEIAAVAQLIEIADVAATARP